MSEVFKIGIEMALLDQGFRDAMARLVSSLLHVKRLQGDINQSFHQMRGHAAALGGMSIFAGYETAKGLMHLADKSKELLDVQTKMLNVGIAQQKIDEATTKFYGGINKEIPTAKVQDWLKTLLEMRAITGDKTPEDFEKAQGLATQAMKYESILNSLHGKTGKNMHGGKGEGTSEYYKMLRSAELKGVATDDTEREKLTEEIFKLTAAFAGKLTPQDILAMARQGGTAWKSLNYSTQDKINSLDKMAVMAADLGGSRAGTTLKGMEQFATGAHAISKNQVEILDEAGLLDTSKLKKGAFGQSFAGLGALKESLNYTGRLPAWIQEVVTPAIRELAKKKKAGGSEGTEEQIFETLMNQAFRNRDTQRFGSMFSDPGFLQQIEKDVGLKEAVKNLEDYYKTHINQSPSAVEESLASAQNNFMQAVGAPIMQAAIPVMQAMTKLFQEMGRIANENPKTIEAIGYGIGILAAALTVGGIATVIAAIGPAGWIAAGITVLVAAVMGFVPGSWEHLKNALLALLTLDVKGFADNMVKFGIDIGTSIISALADVVSKVAAWIDKQFRFPTPSVPGAAPPPDAGGQQGGVFTPQSFQGGWEPGGKSGKVIQISHQASLDGEAIARSLSKYISEQLEHPRQAPYFNGREGYTSPDFQPIST